MLCADVISSLKGNVTQGQRSKERVDVCSDDELLSSDVAADTLQILTDLSQEFIQWFTVLYSIGIYADAFVY